MPELIKKLINTPTSTKKLIEYKEENITAKELVPSVLPIPAFDKKLILKKLNLLYLQVIIKQCLMQN